MAITAAQLQEAMNQMALSGVAEVTLPDGTVRKFRSLDEIQDQYHRLKAQESGDDTGGYFPVATGRAGS